MKRQGKDMLLILTLVVVGLLVLLLLRYRRTNGGYVEVRVSGSVAAVYPLDQDGTYPIEGVETLNMSETQLWSNPGEGNFKIIATLDASNVGDSRWN